ncbi:cytochrome bd oxidase small subunit CydS [Halalkalibacter akibai]
MHNFLLFYAPLLVALLAMVLSFFVATKSTKYED